MSSSLGHFQKEPTIAERLSPPPRVQPSQALGIPPTIGPLSDLCTNDHEEAVSEAETVVLEPTLRNGAGSRTRGRRRDSPDDDDDSDSDDRIERHPKKSRKQRKLDYSSDLSPAPSAPSSPVRVSSHLRILRNGSPAEYHHALSLSRKRKAPIDPEQHTNGSSRTRQANSPMHNTRSSPYSLSPPPTTHRTRSIQTSNSTKTSHKAKRKVPRPLSGLRDKRSSEERSPSYSRQGSPTTGYPQLPRPTAARTPGSPVNPINMPHKPKRDASGRTLLHRAAQRGNLEEVINIYNQNQDLLNEEDNAGYIPLHEASLAGHTDVVNFLLSSGSYVDKQSHTDMDTPLMDAVENGHLEVVRLLLEKGADPRIRNKSGSDALELMSEDKPDSSAIEEAIKAALALQKRRSKRSSDDENRNSAQVESHSSRDPSVASPVHDTAPPTCRHATAGRRKGARTEQTKNEVLWVEGGKNGLQKLREKARLGDSAIVYACLERGVKPDVESLIGAIKGGHDDTVSLLLAFDADADPEPRSTSTGKRQPEETPMLAAIGRNNLKILEYLLDKVDPLRKDSRGRSYMDISRDRAGDLWEQEVKLLQAAYDKALKAGGLTKVVDRSPSSKKKLETMENPNTKRARPRRDSIASASTHRRSESTQSKIEDNNSDMEPTAEAIARQKEHRPKEVDSTVVKKKRRLVSGKDLFADKNLSTSKNQESRSSVSHNDLTTHESRGPQLPKLKTEPKEVDILDIPEVRSSKREWSRERSRERMKAGSGKPITKEAVIGKKRNKENDLNSTAKSSKPTSMDPEKKRRKIDSEELSNREEVTTRKLKKGGESGNIRLKDSRREEMRLRRVGSEARSDGSGKEEATKKLTKEQELLRARKLTKEEEKKKRLAQEEKAERKRRKAEEVERKEREQLAQRREEEEIARKEAERQEMVRRDRLRSEYLMAEQRSIMNQALKESTILREQLEQEKREHIAEENHQKELLRMEIERRMEVERRVEEERREAEERRKMHEEAEKRRIAEEERLRLQLEEEARSRAVAEARLQVEAAERRRVEEEARIQRERLLFEEARRLEEEAEKRRLLEEQRRESLPVALRKVAEAPNVPSVAEVGDYLPLYQAALDETNGDVLPNGSLPHDNTRPKVTGWILNIQAALILGETDLSFQEC